MLIREATADDLPSINAICAASNRELWSLEMIAPAGDRLVVVAATNEELVGIAKTHFHGTPDGEAPAGHYLGGIVVSPDNRRQGIGSALTRARMEWIWSRSSTVYYFANEHNTASITMHERLGFQPVGRFEQIRGVTADQGCAELILFQTTGPGTRPTALSLPVRSRRDGDGAPGTHARSATQ